MVAEATGVPDSVFRRVGLATRLPVMMMRLMFIVICDVDSSVLVFTGRRRFGWDRLLLPLILCRNPSIPGWREKLVCVAIFLSKPETAVLRLTRRKETPAQEPQGVPRRVEDLIGGDPAKPGRRPLNGRRYSCAGGAPGD